MSVYFCPKKLIGLLVTFIWTNIELTIPEKGSNNITHAKATAITGDTYGKRSKPRTIDLPLKGFCKI